MAEPIFRASKRRKVIHKRHVKNEEDPPILPTVLESTSTPSMNETVPSTATAGDVEREENTGNVEREENTGTTLSMSDILRLRRMGKTRRAGVEFSNVASAAPQSTSDHGIHTPSSEILVSARSVLDTASVRFAPQTGQVADTLDKHMMAFIDSKMTEIHRQALSSAKASSNFTDSHAVAQASTKERPAAGVGKLQEVDLGPCSTQANIERTEKLRKRLQTPNVPVAPAPAAKPPRINPKTGKPFREKHVRRTSTDIARDALVEQVLNESRIPLYDEGAATNSGVADESEGAADERIAARFQREFMDSLQIRKDKKPPPVPVGRGMKPEDEMKGPKMGGSRSARAAMKAAKDKKK